MSRYVAGVRVSLALGLAFVGGRSEEGVPEQQEGGGGSSGGETGQLGEVDEEEVSWLIRCATCFALSARPLCSPSLLARHACLPVLACARLCWPGFRWLLLGRLRLRLRRLTAPLLTSPRLASPRHDWLGTPADARREARWCAGEIGGV